MANIVGELSLQKGFCVFPVYRYKAVVRQVGKHVARYRDTQFVRQVAIVTDDRVIEFGTRFFQESFPLRNHVIVSLKPGLNSSQSSRGCQPCKYWRFNRSGGIQVI